MRGIRAIIARWLPAAGVAVVLALLNAITVQQLLRGSADEPQVQLARDTAAALAAGVETQVPLSSTVVDVATSLAPFLIVYDPAGVVRISTARLDGKTPELPGGVLADVAAEGEARFTWQPAPHARLATVVVPIGDGTLGYVLVGRSLAEVEQRITQAQTLSALGAGGAALAALILAALGEVLSPDHAR
jgi:hypothetical protein